MNLKFGKITEMDATKGLAKVTFEEDDNLVTRFLPMSLPKTMKDKWSIPYDVNEHVWCIMDENCEDGVIGGAIYDASNSPGGVAGKNSVQYEGSLGVEFDKSTSTLAISGSGKLKVDITGDVTINCNKAIIKSLADVSITAATKIEMVSPVINLTSPLVTASALLSAAAISTTPGAGGTGNITISGDITSTGKIEGAQVKEGLVRLGTHKHLGVTTGTGTSGTPTS